MTNSHAEESIFFIKNNQIYFKNDGDILELRERARIFSFQNAFNILLKKILDPSDSRKLLRINNLDVSNLVKDYKVNEEKITDINYFSDISVNFSKKKN